MKLHQPNLTAFKIMYLRVIVLFSIKILCLQPTVIVNALGSGSDRLALLEFKKGIANDPLGVLPSWNGSTSFCNWKGVTCSRRHERVTGLNLTGLNMRGSVSPYIGNLTFLRRIDLSNNSFYGKIPPEVGQLFRLQHLDLVNNTFTGEIPIQLYNCSQLRIIYFQGNNLVGRIHPELGSLTKLVRIRFGRNNLTGSIPPSIGNLSSLVFFSIPYNNLEGSIPNEIGRLRNLSVFAIGANKFSGKIPDLLYNISSITVISLIDNKLKGTLPANISLTLPNLQWFGIAFNEFSGPIPLSLSNASKLEVLDLSKNKFVGVVPRDLGNLVHLWFLAVNGNHLGRNSTDDLDFLVSLKNISQLRILDLGDNQFGGVLPNSIANLSSQLSELYLGYNQISGAIPETLVKYTNLQLLAMFGNHFTGIIPSSFGKFQNLQGMYLNENRLSGKIPSSFGNLSQLVKLYLSENRLNGTIPPSIGNCKSLELLDMSRNNLIGGIPKEVGDLSSLSLLLNLSQNFLTGKLPVELGRLRNIINIDVSKNNLSGEIPNAIGDCERLEYLNLQANSFEGVIPSSMANLRGLTYLDLSQNNLYGNISKDLQNLRFLLYFNASFNDLEGEMPTKGVFENASAISVMGNNKLCGGIPELKLPACPKIRETKNGISHVMKLVFIITPVVLCLLLLSSILALCWKRKLKKKPSTEDQDPIHIPKISYKMLYDGTGGFSSNNLIGSGSFGSVYKGTLNQDEIVAVKVLNLRHRGASKSFKAECLALRNIRHRNLVKIITSCSSIDFQGNDFKALVFELMENSSLEEWLHRQKASENPSRNLNFLQRVNIAIDVAYALHYLHIECEPPIIHCDLKPSNVLLDNDMVAHVGDFGLARIIPTINGILQSQSSTIGIRGSVGYAAPEYGMGVMASIQGDVYSYGILLLEMFTGKRPTDEIFEENFNIHQYAKMALPKKLMHIADPRLLPMQVEVSTTAKRAKENNRGHEKVAISEASSSENLSLMNAEMEKCLCSVFEIGLACSVEPPKERMKIGEVIRELLLVKNAFLGAANEPGIRH